MKALWKQKDELHYVLELHETEVLELHYPKNQFENACTLHIGDKMYQISTSGFWKKNIQLKDEKGEQIALAKTESWRAHAMTLAIGDRVYQLVLRNNPLAEWAILDGDETVLSYGLKAEKKEVGIHIHFGKEANNLVLHGLLWFLFHPIAKENSNDYLLLLLTA
jgi:hypothetical protein